MSLNSPYITIIIPTYNRKDNLKNALNSLTHQTYTNFEVIICDDGSTDGTEELKNIFDNLDINYIKEKNEVFRVSHARNTGIKNARGELLLFLDSDTVVPPDFLQIHADTHRCEGKYVVNSYVWRMKDFHETDLGMLPEEYIKLHRDWLFPDSRERFGFFTKEETDSLLFLDANALSIKKRDIEEVGFFDEEFIGSGNEDTDLGCRLESMGYKLRLIKKQVESYHQYHFSIPEEKKLQNLERVVKKYDLKFYELLWQLNLIGKAEIGIYDTSETMHILTAVNNNSSITIDHYEYDDFVNQEHKSILGKTNYIEFVKKIGLDADTKYRSIELKAIEVLYNLYNTGQIKKYMELYPIKMDKSLMRTFMKKTGNIKRFNIKIISEDSFLKIPGNKIRLGPCTQSVGPVILHTPLDEITDWLQKSIKPIKDILFKIEDGNFLELSFPGIKSRIT